MTVRQLFCVLDDLCDSDIVTITDGVKELYRGTFGDIMKTVYAEYIVVAFSQKEMRIEVS